MLKNVILSLAVAFGTMIAGASQAKADYTSALYAYYSYEAAYTNTETALNNSGGMLDADTENLIYDYVETSWYFMDWSLYFFQTQGDSIEARNYAQLAYDWGIYAKNYIDDAFTEAAIARYYLKESVSSTYLTALENASDDLNWANYFAWMAATGQTYLQ